MTRKMLRPVGAAAAAAHISAPAGAALAAVLVAALAALLGGGAAAQTPQVIPRELLQPQVPQRPGAAEPGGPVLETPERERAAPPPGGPTFVLNAVDFEGSSVYAPAELAALVADKIGSDVDFSDLQEITDRVEALYRGDGWLAVRAVIPAQRIAGGRIRVVIVEASVSEVVIRGDLGPAEPQVRRILDRLIGQRPLASSAAERALLLSRDLPGVNLLAALRARQGETPGDLVLLVEGTLDRLDGFASVSNFGSEFSGRVVGTAGVAVNSVALSGDRLEFIGLATLDLGEQVLGQITYDAPTGIDGLRAFVNASSTVSETGGVLRPLDIDYRSRIVTAGLDYTVLRSRERTLSVQGGFDYIHQESNAALPSLAVDEDLRVLFGGARLIEADLGGGLLDTTAAVRVGLDALGASERGDPGLTGTGDTDPSFVSANFTGDYRRALPENLALRGRMLAQVSSGDLPSYERFSLGTYTIGRGFDPGALTGDHGVAASLELSWRPPPLEIPLTTTPEPFAFVDTGRVYGEGESAGLTSVGFGARWQMFERVDAEAFVTVPVQESDLVDEGVRGLFRFTAFF